MAEDRAEPSSMMVVANGRVIFSYGDVAHVSKVRRPFARVILSMLMGKYVVSGKIDMNKTVKQLGLDNTIPFTALEEKATLEQLMTYPVGDLSCILPTDDLTPSTAVSRVCISGNLFFLQQLEV